MLLLPEFLLLLRASSFYHSLLMAIDLSAEDKDRTMKGYASAELEKALKLEFIPPHERRLQTLCDRLQDVAVQLSRNLPEIVIPQKGLLAEKLNANQRKILNAVLWPQYAEYYAAQLQDIQRIPINEGREKMVSLFDVLDDREVKYTKSTEKFHEACGSRKGEDRIMHVRDSVAHKAAALFLALNKVGRMPHIEDCYRPPEVQKGLYIRRIILIARNNPDKNWDEIKLLASSLTAPTAGSAGHQAGAAIDWILRRESDQKFLDAGNNYAEGGAFSCIDFPYLDFNQFRTRMYFFMGAHMGAFKVLPTESWHMSDGDRGMVRGQVVMREARYGPLRDFNRETGEIFAYESKEIDKWYLSNAETRWLVDESRREEPGSIPDLVNEVCQRRKQE